MQVMVLALSIDYQLFFNSRIREEVELGSSLRKAAYISLLHSGHTVVMSGCTKKKLLRSSMNVLP